jgi:hypothetical protein
MFSDFSKPYEYRSPKLVPCPHCHGSGSEDGIMGVPSNLPELGPMMPNRLCSRCMGSRWVLE